MVRGFGLLWGRRRRKFWISRKADYVFNFAILSHFFCSCRFLLLLKPNPYCFWLRFFFAFFLLNLAARDLASFWSQLLLLGHIAWVDAFRKGCCCLLVSGLQIKDNFSSHLGAKFLVTCWLLKIPNFFFLTIFRWICGVETFHNRRLHLRLSVLLFLETRIRFITLIINDWLILILAIIFTSWSITRKSILFGAVVVQLLHPKSLTTHKPDSSLAQVLLNFLLGITIQLLGCFDWRLLQSNRVGSLKLKPSFSCKNILSASFVGARCTGDALSIVCCYSSRSFSQITKRLQIDGDLKRFVAWKRLCHVGLWWLFCTIKLGMIINALDFAQVAPG